MNRIERKFKELKIKKENALITFLTAGHITLEKTKQLIIAKEEAGVDIIEIGIPFSDPLADGPVIQNASTKSLLNGTKLYDIFQLVKEVREETEVPLIFLVYYNMIFNYGNEKFIKKCKEVGIDGLIIPDLPFEEEKELTRYLDKSINLIPLVTPTSNRRVKDILNNKQGFVYCVSSLGTTGQENSFYNNMTEYLSDIRKVTDLPIALGFGIKTREDIEKFSEQVDACIVGSKIVDIIDKTDGNIKKVTEVIKSLKVN